MKLVTLVFASLLSVSAFAAETTVTTFTPTPVTSKTIPAQTTGSTTEAAQPAAEPSFLVDLMVVEEEPTLEVILFKDLGPEMCAQSGIPGEPAMVFDRAAGQPILAGCWFKNDDGTLVATVWLANREGALEMPVIMEFATADFTAMTCDVALTCVKD